PAPRRSVRTELCRGVTGVLVGRTVQRQFDDKERDEMAQAVDEAKLGEFMGQMVGYMTGGAMCFGVWLGDELGLYRVLTDIGLATVDELAGKAGCNPRLTREWLDVQVAGGLIE